ncbi:MAG: ABC transporter substrate-binding protein [Aeromicrobium sp.]|uniref:ABC transporter substrate-binding protein n=1 Tax=Aeromicrobium sp. TaxID=1871063 RepID=UPI0039E6141C
MRRSMLAGIAGALLLTTTACGASSDDAKADCPKPPADVPEGQPARIVAQSTMAAALTQLGLGDRIVGTFGPLENAEGEPDSQVAGLDIECVTDVTGAGDYGDIDKEKVATLEPDLIITSEYLDGDYWYMSAEAHESLESEWEIRTVSYVDKTLTEQLDAVEDLAADLGADLENPDTQAAHEAFADASARAETLGAELTASGKTILAASGMADNYYVSNPEVSADLKYWRSLGLPILVPDNPDPQGYFETLSWEQADKYDGDLVLWDDRIGESGIEQMKQQPVFATITAAKNDAFTPWTSVYPPTYASAAELLDRLVTEAEALL